MIKSIKLNEHSGWNEIVFSVDVLEKSIKTCNVFGEYVKDNGNTIRLIENIWLKRKIGDREREYFQSFLNYLNLKFNHGNQIFIVVDDEFGDNLTDEEAIKKMEHAIAMLVTAAKAMVKLEQSETVV